MSVRGVSLRPSRLSIGLLGVLLAMLVLPRALAAQVDPRGDYRTVRTEHFRVHFAPAHEALARRAAAYAETAWKQFAGELTIPDTPVELLVTDNVDVSNGFATPFPTNRITIFALPPSFVPELRHYDDWLQLVITHELAHIFHLDRARGIWALGRRIFGRNPILLPNALLPSWMIEGLAVHYETKFTGSGRLASTEFPMLARTAALLGAVPPPDAWSLATSRFPLGQHAYGYGSMLMNQLANSGDKLGMGIFVEEVAAHPIPFRLNRAVKASFGISVHDAFKQYRDSLERTLNDVREWSARDTVRRRTARGMTWFAALPRWESDSTVLVAVNNGEDVAGLYRANVNDADITLTRLDRRNTLDANAPTPDGSVVYAQLDFEDPFTLRSTLWRGEPGGEQQPIVGTTRLQLPDVRRADGEIVAVRLVAGSTELVRLASDGIISVLAKASLDTAYTEPRWHPDGNAVVALRLLRGGVQEIVVLDTLGHVTHTLSSQRGISSVPTFTPDGERVVWASDQLGNQQLFIAALRECVSPCGARALTLSATGIGAPSVSPDGSQIAALEFTLQGARLVIVPMHAGYALDALPRLPHSAPYPTISRVAPVQPVTTASTPYSALRQLWPRWWMPLVGEGADGGVTYGLSSSGIDILGRHAWTAQGTVHPSRREFEGSAAYRLSSLPRTRGWQPFLDVSGVQSADRFFVFDSARRNLGELNRVSRFFNTGITFSRPRVRTNASFTVGTQLETRSYSTSPDTLITRLDRLFARGRQTPSVFVSGSWGNVMRAGRAISLEDGINMTGTVLHRWKSGSEQRSSWRATSVLRGYKAVDWGGFSRHAFAARVSGGVTDRHSPAELSIGGASGALAELLPGVLVGDPSRLFPVRGFLPGVQRGSRAITASTEYRAPLSLVARGLGLLPVFLDGVSMSVFTDAGRAWCGNDVRGTPSASALCFLPGVRDGWLASAGAELSLDLGVQWDAPYRLRLGAAQPVARPADVSRNGSVYFTLGTSF